MPTDPAWLGKRVAAAGGLPVVLPTRQTVALVVCRAVAAIAILFGATVAAIAAGTDKLPDAYGDMAAACMLAVASGCVWLLTRPGACALELTRGGFVYRRLFRTVTMDWRQVTGVRAGPRNRYDLPVVRVTGGRKPVLVAGYFDVRADDLAGAMNALRARAVS